MENLMILQIIGGIIAGALNGFGFVLGALLLLKLLDVVTRSRSTLVTAITALFNKAKGA